MDPTVIGFTTLALSQTVTSFYTIMPRVSEIRAAGPHSTIGADVRAGEIVAGSLVIGMGVILSAMARNRMPLTIALISVGLFVFAYEMLLRSDSPFEVSRG